MRITALPSGPSDNQEFTTNGQRFVNAIGTHSFFIQGYVPKSQSSPFLPRILTRPIASDTVLQLGEEYANRYLHDIDTEI